MSFCEYGSQGCRYSCLKDFVGGIVADFGEGTQENRRCLWHLLFRPEPFWGEWAYCVMPPTKVWSPSKLARYGSTETRFDYRNTKTILYGFVGYVKLSSHRLAAKCC